MGLDTTHDCWHGGYIGFNYWWHLLAKAAGIPLGLMEGYWGGIAGVNGVPEVSLEWVRPREGGPTCGSYLGPPLANFVEDVSKWCPISWDVLQPDPLIVLLDHSDCDGHINYGKCKPLADRLEELLPRIPDALGNYEKDHWRAKTRQFISGLRDAYSKKETVRFH